MCHFEANSLFLVVAIPAMQDVEVEGKYLIFMELFDGIDLDRFIKHRKEQNRMISDAEARAIIAQLLSAVKYLHDINITHRDIKPGKLTGI